MQVFVPGSNPCPLPYGVYHLDSPSQKYDSPQIVPSSIFVIGRTCLFVADTWSHTSRTILNFTFQERCLIVRENFAGSYRRKFLSVCTNLTVKLRCLVCLTKLL